MIGAILSGGYGRRLKPITNEIPKPMISIKEGFTILDRQIHDFNVIGIDEIYLLSGHLGEKIEEYLNSKYPELKLHYFKEEKPLGTLYSVKNLLEHRRDEDILLRNGDTVTDVNFKAMLKFARESQYGMIMFATRMKSPYGIIETFGDTVVKFREKPYINAYINAGIYIFKKEIFKYFFEKYHDKELETTVFPALASKRLIGSYIEDVFWMGIDSEKDLEAVREEYRNRVDETWGYVKTISSGPRGSISDFFIKADETCVLKVGKESIIRVTSGSGFILPDMVKYKEGSIIEGNEELKIQTADPTKIEVLSLR